jgi:hypothetical protein
MGQGGSEVLEGIWRGGSCGNMEEDEEGKVEQLDGIWRWRKVMEYGGEWRGNMW